jgi:MFS family permease
MCIGLLLYPLFIRYFSITKCLKLSLSLILLGFVGVCIAHHPTWHILFASLITFFTGIAYVNILTLISNQVSDQHQGWAMGFASTILFIAWLITGFSSGILISLAPFLPFYLGTVGIVIAWVMKRKT